MFHFQVKHAADRCEVSRRQSGLMAASPCGALFAVLLTAAGCSYGPVTDQSGVQSALLLPDQQTVALACQTLRYRPAVGIAAFPDGGVPRYVRDSAVIATVGVKGDSPRILQRLGNSGVHGSASLSLHLVDTDPDHVLVVRSVQASTSQASAAQWWRIAWRDGRILRYPDLKADLSARGRTLGSPEFGDVRVIDPDGTLLLGAQAAGGNELWIRRASGQYSQLSAIKHFYGVQGAELYFWTGDEAQVLNWRTGERRVIARYDPDTRQTARLIVNDATVRAVERLPPLRRDLHVSSDRKRLILRDLDGTETSTPLTCAGLGD